MKAIFGFALTFLIACNSDGQKTYRSSIEIHGADLPVGKDSCFVLQDSVHRSFQIVENSLSDTITLGYAILNPGYTGKFLYGRVGDNSMLDPETPEELLPKTNQFCLRLYRERPVKGKLIIRFE